MTRPLVIRSGFQRRWTAALLSIRFTAFALLAVVTPAPAQTYPSQDVHLICGYPAGSGADIIVRYYAEKLRPIMGRTVIVENKVGAGGNIATEYVARAKPDGHTIYLTGGGVLAANMYLFKKPPVDVAKELQTVTSINRLATMLAVRASAPWQSLAELTAYLKPRGDKATYASSNPVAQAVGELYKQATGVTAVQVSYKTGFDSANDVQSGAVDYAVLDPVYALAQQREGRLRILAISAGRRMEGFPDLPTFAEQGVPMDLLGWWGAFVPAATPRPLVDTLNALFNQVQALPETKKFHNTYGSDPWIATPQDGQARLLLDIKNWAEYVRVAKIEPQG
jgi:tripartite-type tricarboxylate transporter receptor subunit TctC